MACWGPVSGGRLCRHVRGPPHLSGQSFRRARWLCAEMPSRRCRRGQIAENPAHDSPWGAGRTRSVSATDRRHRPSPARRSGCRNLLHTRAARADETYPPGRVSLDPAQRSCVYTRAGHRQPLNPALPSPPFSSGTSPHRRPGRATPVPRRARGRGRAGSRCRAGRAAAGRAGPVSGGSVPGRAAGRPASNPARHVSPRSSPAPRAAAQYDRCHGQLRRRGITLLRRSPVRDIPVSLNSR